MQGRVQSRWCELQDYSPFSSSISIGTALHANYSGRCGGSRRRCTRAASRHASGDLRGDHRCFRPTTSIRTSQGRGCGSSGQCTDLRIVLLGRAPPLHIKRGHVTTSHHFRGQWVDRLVHRGLMSRTGHRMDRRCAFCDAIRCRQEVGESPKTHTEGVPNVVQEKDKHKSNFVRILTQLSWRRN